MAGKVLSQFKQKITGLELVPGSGGCFEVTIDGKLAYSKLNLGVFPDEDKLVADIGRRLT